MIHHFIDLLTRWFVGWITFRFQNMHLFHSGYHFGVPGDHFGGLGRPLIARGNV